MIYSHKPQRGGRSIITNTNNPPQDPPPPKETQIPDVFIEDSTPGIPEVCPEEKSFVATTTWIKEPIVEPTIQPISISKLSQLFSRIKNLWRK